MSDLDFEKMGGSSCFKDAESACAYIGALYSRQINLIKEGFDAYTRGKNPAQRVRAFYPLLRLIATRTHRGDNRRSYGFVPKPGVYTSTLTRPDVFGHYYREQIELLFNNHDGHVEVTLSDTPIPLPFALGEDFFLEHGLTREMLEQLPEHFDMPDLNIMDDEIANGYARPNSLGELPLSLFTAQRVDVSLQRLKHYTGTRPGHFQNYIIFTNYQFYIDEFIKIGRELMAGTTDPLLGAARKDYYAFVEPGDMITFNDNLPNEPRDRPEDRMGKPVARMPQMPAFHLKRHDGSGITMINIGVGPSNAKTITDHVAVLRPHAWLMLGHCAGLRNSQTIGDYVLAHAYLRQDHVLDRDLPPNIPLPALSEIQTALEIAVADVTGLSGYDLKKIMRTGTVATIDDRNWEFQPAFKQNRTLSQSRAIALDMESGTVAANGFRFRVPYGTLLCVSDKPLHGQLKLPGMADQFYRDRVEQHLQIGLRAMTLLRDYGVGRLHSRKLRSFNEVAFQ